MKIDPVAVVVKFLSSRQDVGGYVAGDLVGREANTPTIYVEHAGGFRAIRDCMDRSEVTYQVYAPDRESAADIAFTVREALLEELPGQVVESVQVLDVSEAISPRYFPDITSREHTYLGEVVLYLTSP